MSKPEGCQHDYHGSSRNDPLLSCKRCGARNPYYKIKSTLLQDVIVNASLLREKHLNGTMSGDDYGMEKAWVEAAAEMILARGLGHSRLIMASVLHSIAGKIEDL